MSLNILIQRTPEAADTDDDCSSGEDSKSNKIYSHHFKSLTPEYQAAKSMNGVCFRIDDRIHLSQSGIPITG